MKCRHNHIANHFLPTSVDAIIRLDVKNGKTVTNLLQLSSLVRTTHGRFSHFLKSICTLSPLQICPNNATLIGVYLCDSIHRFVVVFFFAPSFAFLNSLN